MTLNQLQTEQSLQEGDQSDMNQEDSLDHSKILPSLLFGFGRIDENNYGGGQCQGNRRQEEESSGEMGNREEEYSQVKPSDGMVSYSLSQQSEIAKNYRQHEKYDDISQQQRLSLKLSTQSHNSPKTNKLTPSPLPHHQSTHQSSHHIHYPSNSSIHYNLPLYTTPSQQISILNKGVIVKKIQGQAQDGGSLSNLDRLGEDGVQKSEIVQQEDLCEEIWEKQYEIMRNQINRIINQVQKFRERVEQNYGMRSAGKRNQKSSIENKRLIQKQNKQRNRISNPNPNPNNSTIQPQHSTHPPKPIIQNSNSPINPNPTPTHHSPQPHIHLHQNKNKIPTKNINKNFTKISSIEESFFKGLKNQDQILLVRILISLGYINSKSIRNINNNFNDNNSIDINQGNSYNNSGTVGNKLTLLLQQAKYIHSQKQIQKNVNKINIKVKQDNNYNTQKNDKNIQYLPNNNKNISNTQSIKFPNVPTVIMDICQLVHHQRQNNNDINHSSHKYTTSQHNNQQHQSNYLANSKSSYIHQCDQQQNDQISSQQPQIFTPDYSQQQQHHLPSLEQHYNYSLIHKCMQNNFVQTFISECPQSEYQYPTPKNMAELNAYLENRSMEKSKIYLPIQSVPQQNIQYVGQSHQITDQITEQITEQITDQITHNGSTDEKINENSQKNNSKEDTNKIVDSKQSQSSLNKKGKGFISLKKLMIDKNSIQINRNRGFHQQRQKVNLPFTQLVKKRFNRQYNY